MPLYLHKSLCDLEKAGQLATSADRGIGEQRGGDYFHRIQTGYGKDNSPSYRYFRTKDEWDSYTQKKSKVSKDDKKDKKPDSEESLKQKTSEEHKESAKKQEHSLFIKDSKKKIKKSLY
jgi:hypothetical protein